MRSPGNRYNEPLKAVGLSVVALAASAAFAGCQQKETDPQSEGIVVERAIDGIPTHVKIATCVLGKGGKKQGTYDDFKAATKEINLSYLENLRKKPDANSSDTAFENLDRHPVTAKGETENTHFVGDDGRTFYNSCSAEGTVIRESASQDVYVGDHVAIINKAE